METKTLEQEIITEIHKLSTQEQLQVLQYVQSITKTDRVMGEPGSEFVKAARQVNISSDDLQLMEAAIEEWCERVDKFPEVDFEEHKQWS